jgi:hypothetical protein
VIERLVTSGTVSLDGGTRSAVDNNNVWLVGDEGEVIGERENWGRQTVGWCNAERGVSAGGRGLAAVDPHQGPLAGTPSSPTRLVHWPWLRNLPQFSRSPSQPRCPHPSQGLTMTKHQRGFTVVHLSSLPLACSPRTEREPLDFPLSFTPD